MLSRALKIIKEFLEDEVTVVEELLVDTDYYKDMDTFLDFLSIRKWFPIFIEILKELLNG